MFRKKFKVKGEDVDDFMVMQDFAYHSYISSLLKAFLSEKGYSKQKWSTLKIGIQESIESLTFQKDLMFMQHFFVNLECIHIDYTEQKLHVRNRFFDSNNELCAIAITKLCWLDQTRQEVILPPKRIMNHLFLSNTV